MLEGGSLSLFLLKNGQLSLMILWVDDFMLLGALDDIEKMKADLMSLFECKPEGPLAEYVGSKINIIQKESGIASVKFTQPVLLQKLKDELLVPWTEEPNDSGGGWSSVVEG